MTNTFEFIYPITGGLRLQGELQVTGHTDSDGIHIDEVLWLKKHGKDQQPSDVTELIYHGCRSLWEDLDAAAYNHCDGDSCAALSGINQAFSLENDVR